MFVIYAMLAYFLVAMIIAANILRRVRGRASDAPDGRLVSPAGADLTDARLLHRVSLRGRPVRFYRSPLAGPDFPWTVLRDLFEAATDGAGYTVSAEWIYADNPNLAQPIRTATGPELLVSHWAGLELLDTLTSADERRSLRAAFRETMAEAYVLQWAGLSREEFLSLCDEASRRSYAQRG